MQKWAVIPWEKYAEKGDDVIHPEDPSLSVDSILLGIPKQGRRDASAILHHIENSPDISWNSRGEVMIRGDTIPRSHIADLVKFSLFQYKTWKPVGVTEFYRVLAETNLPAGLIRNLKNRELLEKFKTVQPPGIPATKWLTWE